jgi:ribosomal protein L44E
MALPKLNSTPKYEMVIPSQQKKVRFRPYLVKEEKVLLMAFESQDTVQAMKAIIDTILVCVDDKIKKEELTTFDVEYMFTKLRSKSVGERSNLSIECSECKTPNEVSVNIDDIEIKLDNPSETLELQEDVHVEMGYPSAEVLMNMKEGISSTEQLIELIIYSIKNIMTEEEQVSAKDVSEKDLRDFVDSMTGDQFKKVSEFVATIPTLTKDVEFDCKKCGTSNKNTLSGFTDFF